MHTLKVIPKSSNDFKVIAMLVFIFAGVLFGYGCHRKIGVKPREQQKKNKPKCKCVKTKGGVYAAYYYPINNSRELKYKAKI